MRKRLCILLSIILLLTGCQSGSTPNTNEKHTIITTVFPLYDWVNTIIGDQKDSFNVTLLLDSSLDIHNYQPTVDDIISIQTSDLLVCIGGESEEWIDDVLANAQQDISVINAMEVLSSNLHEEEIKEGMQEEHEHEHEEEYDEHVFLSLRNAKVICESILEEICKIDPTNESIYRENANAYLEQLDQLDQEFTEVCQNAGQKVLLFGDRFPFRYFVEDYGIDYYVAFVGCSAETEASFETVRFLAEKVDELQLHYICTIEDSDQKIAKTIRDNTTSKDQEIVMFHSLQSVSKTDRDNGFTYLEGMRQNLEILKEVLK